MAQPAPQTTALRKRKRTAKEIERELMARAKSREKKTFADKTVKVTLYLNPTLKKLLYLEAKAQGRPVYLVLEDILKEHFGME